MARETLVSLSVFGDKAARPTPAELEQALGSAAALWNELVLHVATAHQPSVEQWNYSGAKYGWSLRLKRRDRNLVYLIPRAGDFLAGVVLGAKAVAAAREQRLPAWVLKALASAPRYAEGTGVRLPVSDRAGLEAVKRLVEVKLNAS